MPKIKYLAPFLKWAGRKHKILDQIFAVLPHGDRLIEPFVGSGAVFQNADFSRYLISDTNEDLINLYNILKHDPEPFFRAIPECFTPESNQSEFYYQMREKFNVSDDPFTRSLLFVYLNRHAFNGLCRYNRSGGFNVPFGRYKKPMLATDEMRHLVDMAPRCEFLSADFREVIASAVPGDVIYCDPPYVPISDTSFFSDYTKEGFGVKEQEALAEAAREAAGRGVPVLISNHDIEFTREIYKGAEIRSFSVSRQISARLEGRKDVLELLALFRPS